jgi:AraC-like DNA-binding protein
MAKILLYSIKKDLSHQLQNILGNKFSIIFCGDDDRSLDLKDIQYILAGCDYNCLIDLCANKFIFLYKNRHIPFVIIRPLWIKKIFFEFPGFLLSAFLDISLSNSQKDILNTLKSSEYYPGSSKFPIPPYDPIFKIIELQKIIAEYPLQHHSLSSLSRLLGCSRSWLSFNFHKISGIRLQAFLVRIRCCFALYQILTTNKPIKIISLEAGYKPLYFSQLFRHIFTFSPLVTRKFFSSFFKKF